MMTYTRAKRQLRDQGVTLKKTEHGEFRVTLAGEGEARAYYTDDLDDAISTAEAMVKVKATNDAARAKRNSQAFRELAEEASVILKRIRRYKSRAVLAGARLATRGQDLIHVVDLETDRVLCRRVKLEHLADRHAMTEDDWHAVSCPVCRHHDPRRQGR